MQIKDYWKVISKRWWIFILVAFVASSTAYTYSKLQEPVFRSSAKLYVTPRRYDYGLTMVIQNLIRQYSQQILSDRFLNTVSEQLRLDLPAAALRKKIHTSGTVDNLAVEIQADDSDPGRARAIAKALAEEFLRNHQVRMAEVEKADKVDVYMYDDPKPGELNSPKTRVNVLAAGILGLVLGGIIAFSIEYLDDTIKTSEDVERYVALPVVGSIPSAGP
ncbi:MAG: Wzz/FepE/Etk N-terminal domain-containing protein [Chloroflexota bacterium]